jgi:hypothetical protein
MVNTVNTVNMENSLAIKNNKSAKQWHPIKNGNLTPDEVAAFSGKKVW